MELSKREKKIARELIEKGLQKEFAKALADSREILSGQLIEEVDNKGTYYLLYTHITDFDKHIARRYDGMRPSNYLLIIAAQLNEGFITENDLDSLPEEIKQDVLSFNRFTQ